MSVQWFVRRGEQVRGPFPQELIVRFAAQGKIRDGDELSRDHHDWTPFATLRQQLAPGKAKPKRAKVGKAPARDAAGEQAGALGDASEDDGGTTRTRPRLGGTRRHPDATWRLTRRYIESGRDRGRRRGVQLAGIVGVLAIAAAGALTIAGPSQNVESQCDAAPVPGINWSGCHLDARDMQRVDLGGADLRNARLRGANLLGARLANSDLSYAELPQAELTHADLRDATLMGANLQRADLAYAKLAGANLAYADLSGANLGSTDLAGARLDNAIWVDGSTCAAGSTGACRASGG